jgi:hypothetical protein
MSVILILSRKMRWPRISRPAMMRQRISWMDGSGSDIGWGARISGAGLALVWRWSGDGGSERDAMCGNAWTAKTWSADRTEAR